MAVKVAFLGLGNVGSGVFRLIESGASSLLHRENMSFDVKYALVQNLGKDRGLALNDTKLTNNIDDILNDKEVTIVAEFLGGIEPAADYMKLCLEAGKSVVTANKEALAHSWHLLEQAAVANNVGLYYEASVGGGVPIIKAVRDSLQANNIKTVMGIINGTTNYILTKMSDESSEYDEVLSRAQEKGLAEPDPTADVEGFDVASKLSILASLAFHKKVPQKTIYREGISNISTVDIEYGKELGYTLKLLAIGKNEGNRIECRVHPTFIWNDHPLASVKNSYNAIFLHGDAVGDLMFYGKGAGDMPTASAIISDMVVAAQSDKHKYSTFHNSEHGSSHICFDDNWQTRFYIRLEVADKPGVLAALTGILAKYNVSIESLVQKGHNSDRVPVIFITHLTLEKDMMKAICEIEQLKQVEGVRGLIRVETD